MVFIVYLFTLAPSVVQIDSGELAAVQSTLGIAHPTGYPLFTLIGYLFLKLPLPFTHIYKANLLAAIWCALGIWIFIKSAQILLENNSLAELVNKKLKSKKVKVVAPKENEIVKIVLPSVAGGLFIAFSMTYWSQSASVEVYSLQIFLFNLIIFSVLRAYNSKSESVKPWLVAAVCLALGFANHMTTLLLLPFITILFFAKEKFNSASFKKIGLMLCVFFPLLILLYLYLPVRASTNPEINWGNTINFENFWRHFTGRQYQVWLFASLASAKKQLSYFLQNLPLEFAYAGLLIILAGLLHTYKLSKLFFYCLLATFLFAVFYSINYDIVDIDSYFLLAYIMLGFFAVFGFQKLIGLFPHKTHAVIISSLVVLFCSIEAVINFSAVDQSDIHTFQDYTKAVLKNADRNSVIFTYTWDYFVSPSYYFQYSEGLRKDIAVIDKELLRRSWYYNQMETDYPDVIKNIHREISDFLEALKPFERNENFNPNLLEKDYRAIMTKLVAENANHRTFYIGLELAQNEMRRGEFTLPEGYYLVPDIFMLKVVHGTDYVPAKDPDFTIRFPKNSNKYINNIKNFIGSVLMYRAEYELSFNKTNRARIYTDKIRSVLPDFEISPKLLQQIYNEQ